MSRTDSCGEDAKLFKGKSQGICSCCTTFLFSYAVSDLWCSCFRGTLSARCCQYHASDAITNSRLIGGLRVTCHGVLLRSVGGVSSFFITHAKAPPTYLYVVCIYSRAEETQRLSVYPNAGYVTNSKFDYFTICSVQLRQHRQLGSLGRRARSLVLYIPSTALDPSHSRIELG